MYSIHAFAELAGVTIKALRHYERVGLLAPQRTGSRYRRYSLGDLQRLERILALKSLGLPLKTIRTLLKGDDVPLRAHREALEEKRARLDRAIAAITTIEQDSRPAEALTRFLGGAAWDRWEGERQRRALTTPRAPDRAGESRIALFREIQTALDGSAGRSAEAFALHPAGERARQLATRWCKTIDPEMLEALTKRARWPDGMRRYVASLYDTTPDIWERASASSKLTGEQRQAPGRPKLNACTTTVGGVGLLVV